MKSFQNFRKEFQVFDHCTFLNHAAVSPTHARLQNRVQDFLADTATGSKHEEKWLQYAETVRQLAARLIEANDDEIAFVNNVTTGAALVANGIPLGKDDNIVLSSNQFPANVYPWLNLRERGVNVQLVDLPHDKSGYDILFNAIDDYTRLVAMCFVEYDDGFRHDIARLSNFCKERHILLFIDAVQGLGALQFSVKQTPVDFLAVSGHKWLIGPTGQGFLYVNHKVIDSMYILSRGWLSVDDPWDFHDFNQSFKKSASQIEGGTSNLLGIAALGASLEMLLEADPLEIELQVLALNSYLRQKLSSMGYKLNSDPEERFRSGILSFRHPHISTSEIYQRLIDRKVEVSQRNGNIRVSPHFYNTVEDLDVLVASLPI